MRTFKLSLVLAVIVMGLCASGMVYAADGSRGGGHSGGYSRGGGHDGGHWGHHGGSHFDFDFVFGGPFWGASWYYPYYYPYYYPSYYPYYNPYYYSYAPAEQSMPQEYIERPRGERSSRPSGVWYYCPKSKAYYPYVRECPGGWQNVPAQPPSESGR